MVQSGACDLEFNESREGRHVTSCVFNVVMLLIKQEI
jgi:hypothetical protein